MSKIYLSLMILNIFIKLSSYLTSLTDKKKVAMLTKVFVEILLCL